jgi:cell division protein FtsB
VSVRRSGGRGSSSASSRPSDDDLVADEGGTIARASRRTARRMAWPLVLTLLVCTTLALGVFPTRTYLEKKQQVSLAQQQLDNLTRENDEMQARVDQLQTSEEIEAIARRDYQLVLPGEESYVILPPPEEPVQLPEGWPFDELDKSLTRSSRRERHHERSGPEFRCGGVVG